MDDWPLEQQCPRLWADCSSPSIFVTMPSSTVIHTPHSFLPQARQHERMCWTSVAWPVSVPSARASEGVDAKGTDAATAATAAAFTKLRRDSVKLFMPSFPSLSVCHMGVTCANPVGSLQPPRLPRPAPALPPLAHAQSCMRAATAADAPVRWRT